MIILPNKGLGFIPVTKCASTTIEAALSKRKGIFIGGTTGLKHTSYRRFERHILPLLEASSVNRPHFFAITREPADRLLSWYKFRQRDQLAKAPVGSSKNSRYLGDTTFEEFVEKTLASSRKPKFKIDNQKHFLVDLAGDVAVDTLIRLEHVDDVLPAFLKRFKVNLPNAAMTRKNISPEKKAVVMSADLRDRINHSERFKPDYNLYISAACSIDDIDS